MLEATAEKLTLCECECSAVLLLLLHTHIIQSKGDDDFFSAALNLGSFSESLDIIVVIFLTPQGPRLEAMASKKDHILETHFV